MNTFENENLISVTDFVDSMKIETLNEKINELGEPKCYEINKSISSKLNNFRDEYSDNPDKAIFYSKLGTFIQNLISNVLEKTKIDNTFSRYDIKKKVDEYIKIKNILEYFDKSKNYYFLNENQIFKSRMDIFDNKLITDIIFNLLEVFKAEEIKIEDIKPGIKKIEDIKPGINIKNNKMKGRPDFVTFNSIIELKVTDVDETRRKRNIMQMVCYKEILNNHPKKLVLVNFMDSKIYVYS